MVVYLVALGVDLELADEVAQLAEAAGGQDVGRGVVEHGYLVETYFRHVLGEVAVLNGQQGGVVAGAEHGPAHDGTDNGHENAQADYIEGHCGLLPGRVDILLRRASVEAAEYQRRGAPHKAEQDDKDVEVAGVYIKSRQGKVEVQEAEYYGDEQAQEDGFALAHGLARLLGSLVFALRRSPAVLAAFGVLVEPSEVAEVAKVESHRIIVLQWYFETANMYTPPP